MLSVANNTQDYIDYSKNTTHGSSTTAVTGGRCSRVSTHLVTSVSSSIKEAWVKVTLLQVLHFHAQGRVRLGICSTCSLCTIGFTTDNQSFLLEITMITWNKLCKGQS